MSAFALALAGLCGLTLTALAAGLLSFLCMHRAMRAAAQRTETRFAETETVIESLRNELQACARQIHEIPHEVPKAAQFAGAGPALNLSKRSQALRMHRRGDAPEQIASTLGIPRQEVELLLKVHRLVIAGL